MIRINCKNNNKTKEFAEGVTFLDIYNGFDLGFKYKPMCVLDCNKRRDLTRRVYQNTDVEFLTITSSIGLRTYTLGLFFILYKAVSDLFPGAHVEMANSISKGIYCPLNIGRELVQEDIDKIKTRMEKIISDDIPFVRHKEQTDEVIKVLEEAGRTDATRLMKTLGRVYGYYYTLDNAADCFFGILPPSTGFIDNYDLILNSEEQGVLIRIPNKQNPDELEYPVPQEKMFEIFKEYHAWQRIMEIVTVGDLNIVCKEKQSTNFINIAEALQAKKIVHIADTISNRRDEGEKLKIVLISGPSSSGKTTFSKRLQVQLLANGVFPKVISLDDYFLDRDNTPLDENGEHDFETLNAIDIDFYNKQLKELLDGNTVDLPTYNFKTGKREFNDNKMSLGAGDILIVEGIHALNPNLMPDIPDEYKFLIYVSALTSIRLDEHNYIPTTDNRLLRRILRDYKYRGTTAKETIARWPSVRAGEEKWIFPYQENADVMFNSAMVFEIAVLKDLVDPILAEVPENCPEFAYADQLRRFLSLFISIPSQKLPPTSLIREFIGGSSFHY